MMTELNSSVGTASGPGLSGSAIAYLESRGLDVEVATQYGLYSSNHGEIGPSIVFPFLEKGEVVNLKYRNRDKEIRQTKGGKRTLWNADVIERAAKERRPLLITEGEIDALTAIQCGYPWTVSVPGGAPQKRSDEPIDVNNDDNFNYIWDNADAIMRVPRIILAGDGDGPGSNLNYELQKRLGVGRCLQLEYPEGKDLNELLQAKGPKAVMDCIEGAEPYPVKGLHRLEDFGEVPAPETFKTGFGKEMDMHLKVSPGYVMVVTGVPTHGKSTWVDCLCFNLARNYQWKFLVGTFEAPPVPHWRNQMRRRYTGKSDMQITDSDATRVDNWLSDHFYFMGQNTSLDDDLDLDVDEIINLAKTAVIRHGIKCVVIDPWNEIEHKHKHGETETAYVARALRQFKKFARTYQVLVIIVAHPRKPKDDTYTHPPSLYSIEGSNQWRNKPELGVVVWRPDTQTSECEIQVQKVKFMENGRHGTVRLEGDRVTGRYREYDV